MSNLIKQRTVITALLFMVFLVQSMPSMAMACQHAMPGAFADQVMETMDHSAHGMSMSDSKNKTSADCCGQDCSCPTGSCASVALVTHSSLDDVKFLSQKFIPLPAMLVAQAPALPFRPPIFA